MRTSSNRAGFVSLLLAGALAAQALVALISWRRAAHTEDPVGRQADQLAARWELEYVQEELVTKTPIKLGFSKALSKRFTRAQGQAEMNFRTGRVAVSIDGLDPLFDGSVYEMWLVDNVPGSRRTIAIDLGEGGDRILNLGNLSATGTLVTSVDVERLADFDVDMAAVMRVAPNRTPEYVIGGMQSIRYQLGRQATIAQGSSQTNVVAAGFGPTHLPSLAFAPVQSGTGKKLKTLIAQGENLFFNATFGGNGRTCGACHRAVDNLTIDVDFIATLPPTDPLFIAEGNPALPAFDVGNPNRPAMEDPSMMRRRGLILENIEGFDVDSRGALLNAPFFRASPSLFNLSSSAPYGLSNCCQNLQDFAAGAVVQHFTKTLNRTPGVDFVLPTGAELQALEAFMLSNVSPANQNFRIAGRNSLLSTKKDPTATDTTRPEVRGRDLFETVGCTLCHLAPAGAGGTLNLNTGVEALEHDAAHFNPTPTIDTGDGSGQFQVPQIFGLRKNHFFHTGLLGNQPAAISGQTLRFTNLRDAVNFYTTPAFATSPGGVAFPVTTLSPADVEDLAHFLEAISNP